MNFFFSKVIINTVDVCSARTVKKGKGRHSLGSVRRLFSCGSGQRRGGWFGERAR